MLSIIIPTFNSEKYLPELLKRIDGQSGVMKEIIIVDSSSADNTVAIAESAGARVLHVKKEDFDHGGTRNMAAQSAKGDIIIFLTHDALPVGDHAFDTLIRPLHDDEKIGASYGRQLPYPDATPFAAHMRYFNYPETSCIKSSHGKEKGIKVPFISNAFAAYRKRALQGIGGFKECMILGEDVHAGARILLAGYGIAYVADAAVLHSHNYSPLQEFKRYFDIGVFHKKESWILETFGRAEGEGVRFLKSEFYYLIKNGNCRLLGAFIIRNGLKYMGYALGRNYVNIPERLIKKLSMHSDWWNKSLKQVRL